MQEGEEVLQEDGMSYRVTAERGELREDKGVGEVALARKSRKIHSVFDFLEVQLEQQTIPPKVILPLIVSMTRLILNTCGCHIKMSRYLVTAKFNLKSSGEQGQ